MAQKPTTANRKAPQRGGHRLDISVWQFVRIMVQLEAVAKSRGRRRRTAEAPTVQQRPIYADWRSAWQEVDRELTRLGEADSDAFSDLMMNQNVVLEVRGRSQINEVTRAIENIVHQMRAEVRASVGDEEHISDLRFEVRELEKLTKKLSGLGRKKAKPAPAKAEAAEAFPVKPLKPSATRSDPKKGAPKQGEAVKRAGPKRSDPKQGEAAMRTGPKRSDPKKAGAKRSGPQRNDPTQTHGAGKPGGTTGARPKRKPASKRPAGPESGRSGDRTDDRGGRPAGRSATGAPMRKGKPRPRR